MLRLTTICLTEDCDCLTVEFGLVNTRTLMCNHVRLLERNVLAFMTIMEAGLPIVLVGLKRL